MDKVLIAYSTWAGATHQIADEIGKDLSKNGLQVNVLPAKDVRSISEYDAVILGTSIHAGQMTGDFNRFLNGFHKELAVRKTAFFVSCFNMIEENEKNKAETLGWLNKSISKFPEIKPITLGMFAGAAVTDSEEFNKLNVLVKKIIESMKTSMNTEKGKSDFRNWEMIHAWSDELVGKIV